MQKSEKVFLTIKKSCFCEKISLQEIGDVIKRNRPYEPSLRTNHMATLKIKSADCCELSLEV